MEGQPKGSSVDKLDLIEKFKEGDPEAALLMQDWCHEEQLRIRRGEITRVDYYLSKAEIYREGGLVREAMREFEKGAEIAASEGRGDILSMCEYEIERLREAL